MTTHIEQLRELVAAGEKATQGNYTVDECNSGLSCWCRCVGIDHSDDDYVAPSGCLEKKDAEFITTAANTRPTLSAILEKLESVDVDALEEALNYSIFVQKGCEPIMQAAKTLLQIIKGE